MSQSTIKCDIRGNSLSSNFFKHCPNTVENAATSLYYKDNNNKCRMCYTVDVGPVNLKNGSTAYYCGSLSKDVGADAPQSNVTLYFTSGQCEQSL